MKARLVCDALQMAVWQRQPQAGLIVHSNRGSQYASKQYRQLLKIRGFISSMSRVGNCWENKRSVVSRADKREDKVRHDSVAERLFGSLKQEQIHRQCYLTRYAAQQDVLQYISCFITAIDCIHTWATKVQTNMRQKWKC